MKLALIQLHSGADEAANLDAAAAHVRWAAANGADMAVLPEMFCCPYDTAVFPQHAEADDGARQEFLSALARQSGLYLAAGSVPEAADGRVYNTAYVYDRAGRRLAKHRKAHLFDIDIAGGQAFRESDALAAGDGITVFDTEFGRFGVMICFDIRFPAFAEQYAAAGVDVLLVPASFNPTTGPAHWELLFRARAVDCQCFTIGAAGAQNPRAAYPGYGHSIAVSPWGEVLCQLGAGEERRIVTLEPREARRVRQQIPLRNL